MNKRGIGVLSTVISAGGPVSFAYLAKERQVSERTIRNDLADISAFLNGKGLSAFSFRSDGTVQFIADSNEVFALIERAEILDYHLSKVERRILLILELLLADEYVTLSQLADMAFISRATFLNDLPEIKEYLASRRLEVVPYSNRGIRVIGTEAEKRAAAMGLLVSAFPAINERGNVFQNIILRILDRGYAYNDCEAALKKAELTTGLYLSDSYFTHALYYLLIGIRRIKAGHILENHSGGRDAGYEFAEKVFRILGEKRRFIVTESEIRFFAGIMISLNYQKNSYWPHSGYDENILKLQTAVAWFIRKISDDLSIDLSDDFIFYENLITHLCDLGKETYDNAPIPADIQWEPVITAIHQRIREFSLMLGYSLDTNESGYIILHVCAAIERKKNRLTRTKVVVVCANGIGVSQFLSERLRQQFNFEIYAATGLHSLEQYLTQDIDLIISTVPISGKEKPTVTVTPLLSDLDYLKIQKALSSLPFKPEKSEETQSPASALLTRLEGVAERHITDAAIRGKVIRELSEEVTRFFGRKTEEGFALSRMLTPDHIQLNVSCPDWRDAVRQSAGRLVKSGCVTAAYAEAAVKNIEENGPYIVISHGFALPHAGVDSGVNRGGMFLIRLKEPVSFGNKEFDPVDLVCCIAVKEPQEHKKSLFNLVNMLHLDGFTRRLRFAASCEEAYRVIEEFEEIVINRCS